MLHPDDTIVALSSAGGPGGRAVVRLTGPAAWGVVARVFHATNPDAADPNLRARHIGAVHLSGVDAPFPAVLYFWPGPRTYTGQPLAEMHVLSSPPLVERLIADLLVAGARAAGPGEFTLRSFLAGKKDLPQAEAVLAVIEAGTDADLKKALAQLAGGVSLPLHRLRDDLLNLLADVEAALDFADEDIQFVDKATLLSRIAAGLAHLTNLKRQFDDRGVSGRAVRVAIVGHPNAGKSSLFNALAGTPVALVSPRAGTTRDYLTRRLDLAGIPVDLIDTAGWQPAADTIDEQAQALGQDQANRADILIWCVPAGDDFDPADATRLAALGAELIRVATMCDLARPTAGVPTSAVLPGGIAELHTVLGTTVTAVARPPLAPSQSRCRAHVDAGLLALRRAHAHAREDDPPELLALALREGLEQVGAMAGTVYTNDLLDRIFSRFCIGK